MGSTQQLVRRATTYGSTRLVPLLQTTFAITGVICLMALYAHAPGRDRIADFMNLYVGASLVGSPDLYNEEAGWRIQDAALLRHSTMVPFSRLPIVALLYKPLSLLPYVVALRLEQSLVMIGLIIFVWVFPCKPLTSAAALCWSIPVAAGFWNGQDAPLLIMWLALSLRCYRNGKQFSSGVILSLCIIKWHFIVLVPLLLISRAHWRFVGGFATGIVTFVTLSFVCQGWSWPVQYWRLLMWGHVQNEVGFMFNFRALFMPWQHALLGHIVCSIGIIVLVGFICYRSDFELALCCCLAAATIISVHVYNFDMILTIPLCLLLLARGAHVPVSVLTLLSPLAFIFVLAAIVSVVVQLAMIATGRIGRPGLAALRSKVSSMC